ncbi:MAG: hypothetical protein A2Y38_10390 [Spirochaetes bacterium GWB1_59_5]|nr:MAG: hypothetical protein A2Y38_10390 [Spirochaetes bacterium GWB1_59_5]
MATGAGANRAVTVDQVGPQPTRQKTARSTQVPAKGNTDIRAIHASGATGDAAEDTSGDDLTELLPDAAVACPPSDTAERTANAFLKTNAKMHWATRAKTAVALFQDRRDVLGLICKKDKPGVARLIQDLLR